MSATDVACSTTAPTDAASTEPAYEPSSHRPDVVPSTADDMEVSPAPEGVPLPEPLQSQPMTATASNSSQNPPGDDGEGSSAPTYGTRSRNRTGGARPNYAEDKELDMEIEAAGRVAKPPPRKVYNTLPPPNPMPAVEPAPAPSGFAAVNSHPLAHTERVFDTLPPGMSSPTGTVAPSKKRKQPGSNTTVNGTASSSAAVPRTKPAASTQSRPYIETNMMSFHNSGARLNSRKQLVADDGTILSPNDHVYMVCEPPGEPYYLARIMEFLHVNNELSAPVDAIKVNWYYRPKDIQRRVQDARVVFASMHSDTCPLTSLRGACNIQHLSEISNVDDYRVLKDSFWFDKLYDRYMQRYYEVVPTSKVVNVPSLIKAVLDERWKFVLIEIGRGRDLTSASKKCKKCEQFAANHDSVDCAVCKHTYHMRCVRPPLLKKPARGFAWACAACSRAQELRLEARHTPTVSESQGGDDEAMDEDDEDGVAREHDTRDSSAAPEPHPPPTAAQIAQANLWPWRYLGVHSRVEDALDYDDRIYPRASSRLGPRHQANVNVWHGRPVELVKPAEIKKKYLKTAPAKKGEKPGKEAAAAIETDREQRLKRPKWVVDEPVGYIARGLDDPVEIKGKKEYTSQLTFKMPDPDKFTSRGEDDSVRPDNAEELVDDYMKRVKALAQQYDVLDCSTDFLTKAIEKLQENEYDVEKALTAMRGLSRRTDLKQPDLNREEIKRFEDGVAKFGSELHSVARHVGPSVKESRIVRFYYQWKKTEKGRQIWGTFEGRRSKKESKRVDKDGNGVKLLDDVANDQDDSAFDDEKAAQKKRGFECKFCTTRSSRQWRRAPGTAPGTLVPRDPALKTSKDKSNWLTLALCGRCAYLWRRYAIQYESIEEVSKKIAAAGGRASKRRVDEELMRTIFEAQHESGDLISPQLANEIHKSGMEVPLNIVQQEEPPKKKLKEIREPGTATPDVIPPEKKKVIAEPVVEAPLKPDMPRVKIHPCAVCHVIDLPDHELLKCRDCRLHVHGCCYGVGPKTNTKPWFCDMCRNDHNLQVSTVYECVLCPVRHTAQELMEPLRASHKKKSDREREKERLEREMIQEAGRRWRHDQEAAGRPVDPREALKRTAWNNWVHITCAMWNKEVKFGTAEVLDDAEGVGFIPRDRYETVCKICKQSGRHPVVKCHITGCTSQFHVGCARQAEYTFGFDVALVKSSRRDSVSVMKLEQETGLVTAGIWCPNHVSPTYVHSMLEPTENGLTAMQLFARTYKQVDTTMTGTVRRAAQFTTNVQTQPQAMDPPVRRASTINGVSAATGTQVERIAGHSLRASPDEASSRSSAEPPDGQEARSKPQNQSRDGKGPKKCCTCLVTVSPKWWLAQRSPPNRSPAPATSNGALDQFHDRNMLLNGTAPLSSPRIQAQTDALSQPHDTMMTNGVVKAEPSEYPGPGTVTDPKNEFMYQCHKCHVQKRTPPSSPSQVRPPSKTYSKPDPVLDANFTYGPNFAPSMFSPSRPPVEGPPHSHPLAPPVVTHHSPWQGGPAQWSAPVMRNGSHSIPPPPPQNGNMYNSTYRPPPADYSSPYNRPSYPPSHASVLPPNGVSQRSPPPSYSMHQPQPPPPHSAQPSAPGRPTSPRYGSGGPSPRMGPGSTSMLSRPYAPEPPRSGPLESPTNGYGQPPAMRSHAQPPPLPPMRPASSQAQSLAQIALAASEQSMNPSSSRQPSMDGTPRLGDARISRVPESPTQRPITPAVARRDENRVGPGASASPSLRNLLS